MGVLRVFSPHAQWRFPHDCIIKALGETDPTPYPLPSSCLYEVSTSRRHTGENMISLFCSLIQPRARRCLWVVVLGLRNDFQCCGTAMFCYVIAVPERMLIDFIFIDTFILEVIISCHIVSDTQQGGCWLCLDMIQQ